MSKHTKEPEMANSEAINPDTASSINFLKTIRPSGYIALTAICPDTKDITTTTYLSHQYDEISAWIDRHQDRRNIYYSLNSIIKAVQSKAKRTDIQSVDYLHVDIDPQEGKDIKQEQKRILESIRQYKLKPTYIIYSGGGYQVLWKLKQPIPVNGDMAQAEEAKLYNVQLERELGGDNCHNIDRVLRLPGTINIPNEIKIKKGRKKAAAKVIEYNPDCIYDISEFTKAEKEQPKQLKVIIGEDIKWLNDLDDLDIVEWVKELISTGKRKGKEYKSRSEALFAVICELIKCFISPEIIFAIITDKKFKISASVLDKPNPKKYAIRQIERAQEFIIADWLAELNDNHAVIKNWGGKCRVATFVYDNELERSRIDLQSFSDISNAYSNRRIQVGENSKGKPIMKGIGEVWLKHEMRRQYDIVVFSPKGDVDGALNLWEGFGVKPVRGCWNLMRNHITDVLACGDKKSADYILKWMAFAVQYPEQPAGVALVFKGGKGTGKGFFGNAMCDIFGQHSMHISNIGHLTGRFNAHLHNTCLLFADEAYWPGHKSEEGNMKALITEPTITIERKGIDAEQVTNRLHIIMASNEDWVVPATAGERRFAVFELSSKYQQDHEYFSQLSAELNNGGLEAMLYDLLNMDIAGWHPREDVPQTTALNEQKVKGLSPVAKVWYNYLVSGDFPHPAKNNDCISTTWFAALVNSPSTYKDVTAKDVANFFGSPKFNSDGSRKQQSGMGFEKRDNQRPRGFLIPDLKTCREAWDKVMFPVEWDDNTEWSR